MINGNNQYWQNATMNIRKDNDEWKNAAGTCSANLIQKVITENGEYNAKEDGADGYSSVKVEVPSASETFEVTFSIPNDTESMEFRSTKTYSEIYEAITSGKKVIGSLNVGGLEITIGSASLDTYTTFEKPEGEIVIPGILFSFLGVYYNDDGVTKYMYLFMYHDDTNDRDMMKYSDFTYEIPYDAICTKQIDN